MTDLERQLALAKMLPEKLRILTSQENFVVWNHEDLLQCRNVLETEWLHICHLIEQGLDAKEHEDFRQVLAMKTEQSDGIERPRLYSEASERDFCSATWQQRADALIAVKKGPPCT